MDSDLMPARTIRFHPTGLATLVACGTFALSMACTGKESSSPSEPSAPIVPVLTVSDIAPSLARLITSKTLDALRDLATQMCKAEFPRSPCGGFFDEPIAHSVPPQTPGPFRPQGFETTRACSDGGSMGIKSVPNGLHY